MISSSKNALVFIFFVGFLSHVVDGKSSVSAAQMTTILDNLVNKKLYDKRLRPNYNGKPVRVGVGFWIISIDSIDVVNMDYTIDLFLRQNWVDPRLDHSLNETVFLSYRIVDNIWTPDTYFVNAKTSWLHHVTALNVMVMLAPNGVVKHNTRATVKAACNLDLRLFPIDKQICPLILESYGYHSDHITYNWETNSSDGMVFVPELVRLMPQYQLTRVRLTTEFHPYIVGNFSAVRADFYLDRTYSYFLSHIYGTSTVVVIISWMAFVLPRDQTAARVSVGVTSLLTEVTVIDMLNSAMPKVSYVKSIDKFLITCLIYVFLSLVEYCIVLALDKRLKTKLMLQKRQKEYEKAKKQVKNDSKKTNWMVVPSSFNHPNEVRRRTDCHEDVNEQDLKTQVCFQAYREDLLDRMISEKFIDLVDSIALIIFPGSFATFQLWYWLNNVSKT